jgi:hypothetical protein
MRGRFHRLAHRLALLAAIGFGMMALPTVAAACIENDCKPAAAAKSQHPQQQQQQRQVQQPQRPLRLETFRRQPVALGNPTRVVKTPAGDYAKVKLTRRAKSRPDAPQFLPVALSPEAEAALAMQAAVRVVEADEVNEIDRAADPLVPVRVMTTSEPPARAAAAEVSADDRNADEQVSAPAQAMATAAVPAQSPEPATGLRGSLWRYVSWLSDTLGALFAAVRCLFGS